MDGTEVALAALGVLGTCIGLMVWVVKKVLGDVAPALLKHTEAAYRLSEAVERTAETQQEVLTFMKNLNGKLTKATVQTAKEQSKGG